MLSAAQFNKSGEFSSNHSPKLEQTKQTNQVWVEAHITDREN